MHTQADFLTLLSARNDGPFWTSLPGPHLAGAFVFSVSATTLIGALLKADSIAFWACPIGHIGVTLLYNLAMFLVLDIVKVRSRPSHSRKSGGVGGMRIRCPRRLDAHGALVLDLARPRRGASSSHCVQSHAKHVAPRLPQ